FFRGARVNFEDLFGGFGSGGFDSIFESIFGRGGFGGFGGGGFGRERGADLVYETSITLEDVLKGKREEIDIPKYIDCENCKGSGCAPGTSMRTCTVCNGHGQVRTSRSTGFSTFVTVHPCNTCRGQGKIIERSYSKCKGTRKKRKNKKIIKLKGKVLPHQGSRGRGDQYVRLVANIPTKLDKRQKKILEELRDTFD